MKKNKHKLFEWLWDAWCLISLLGIWPRFIEPNLLAINGVTLKIPKLPKDLNGLKILQFSDLHLHEKVPNFFLNHAIKKSRELNPDIIVFTGDFLCMSQIKDRPRLKQVLCSFAAPYGCYAVLGNHDYDQYASINEFGEYDIIEEHSSNIVKGFKQLFSKVKLQKRGTSRLQNIKEHRDLIQLLKETPFELLNNQTKVVKITNSALNICGLGEYILGKCQPEIAFKNYDDKYIGIVLSHNPDSISILKDYPGSIVLSGHTHGGQINLPFLWKKLTLLEDLSLKRGLKMIGNKLLYINRGLGAVLHFRWFAMPELMLLTLEPNHES